MKGGKQVGDPNRRTSALAVAEDFGLVNMAADPKDEDCRRQADRKLNAPSDRLGQKGIKRGIDQRRGTPADSPAGLDDTDAAAAVFVADHLAHQHRPGRPFPAKAEPVQRAQYEELLKILGEGAVNIEYHKIVICSMRTRPKRSAKVPENHPPSDEISKVTVPMRPAWPRDTPQSAINVGITKLYICTSNASSAQPPKQAPMVRRSVTFNSPNQASIASLSVPFPGSWRTESADGNVGFHYGYPCASGGR